MPVASRTLGFRYYRSHKRPWAQPARNLRFLRIHQTDGIHQRYFYSIIPFAVQTMKIRLHSFGKVRIDAPHFEWLFFLLVQLLWWSLRPIPHTVSVGCLLGVKSQRIYVLQVLRLAK